MSLKYQQFIRHGNVRAYINRQGKRCSREFLLLLEEFIARKLEAACLQHNGGRKTVDAGVIAVVGLGPR